MILRRSSKLRRMNNNILYPNRGILILGMMFLWSSTTITVTSFTMPSTRAWSSSIRVDQKIRGVSSSSLFLNNDDKFSPRQEEEKRKELRRRKERNQSLRVAANELKRKRKQAANLKAVEDLFSANILLENKNENQNENYLLQSSSNRERPLVDLNLMGRGVVGDLIRPERSVGNQGVGKYQPVEPIRCLFLTTPDESETMIETYLQQRYPDEEYKYTNDVSSTMSKAIPVPIPLTQEESKALKLVSFAFRGRPVSKSVFLPLSLILTNRDEALWDNLPWTTWTIDPQGRNVDYDGKPIDKKYLLGKRDAYYRMNGKDWFGRGLDFGNTAARLKYTLEDYYDERTKEQEEKQQQQQGTDTNKESSENLAFDESSLAYRILQLQAEEAKSLLADAERQYALVRTRLSLSKKGVSDEVLFQNYNEINTAIDNVNTSLEQKNSTQEAIQTFLSKAEKEEKEQDDAAKKTELESIVNDFLTDLVSIEYFNAKEEDDKTTTENKDVGIIDTVKQTISDKVSSLPEVKPTALEEARTAAQSFITSLQDSNSTVNSNSNTGIMGDLSLILDRENYNLASSVKNTATGFLDRIIERETQNAPPYRGAMGYAPKIDTKEEMFTKSVLPYSSPYDLLLEIIEEQFQAEVVAVVLENTSLFPGTLVVEGAVVLRRKGGPPKTLTLFGGETVEVADEDQDEDYGNAGVTAGTTYLVECASEEAIGIALACGSKDMPISVERQIWTDVGVDVKLDDDNVERIDKSNLELESVLEIIPPVKEIQNSENNVRVAAGGEALVGGSNSNTANNDQNQQTNDDSPTSEDDDDLTVDSIQYVDEYDELTIPQKARMILSSGKLEDRQKLPRPRVLRTFEQNLQRVKENPIAEDNTRIVVKTRLSPLDELLVPMLGNKMLTLELFLRDSEQSNNTPMVQKYQIDIEELEKKIQKEKEDKEKKPWWKLG